MLACAGLCACTLLSGAADLVVAEALPTADAALPPRDDAAPDVAVPDAAIDARTTCDEPGLVGRWTFDEGGGETVFDCTTRRHDGRNDGGTYTAGRDGGAALAFDGGWVGFGDPADLAPLEAVTLCAWVNLRAAPDGDPARAYVLGKLADPAGRGFRLAIAPPVQGGPRASINVPDGDGGIHETAGGRVPIGTWTHVCATHAAGAQAVYVGGKLAVSESGLPTAIRPSTAELRIGARGDGDGAFVGTLDDVRLYARALTAEEIAELSSR